VAEEYLKSFTEQWDGPTDQFVTKATGYLRTFIHNTIDARCGRFLYGSLPSHVRYDISILSWYRHVDIFTREIIDVHIEDCLSRTRAATNLLLKLEKSGHTRNERYYRECKDAFLTHLKIQRDLASRNPVLRGLQQMSTKSKDQPHASFVSSVGQAIGNLSKAGFPRVDELELAKLLRPQASDAALEDMAKASAGFEGASRPITPSPFMIGNSSKLRPDC